MGFGATGGAASQALNGVMSALDQQATLQQQRQKAADAQRQQSLKDQMEAYTQGAIDVPQPPRMDPSAGNPSAGLPPSAGLINRDPAAVQSAAQGGTQRPTILQNGQPQPTSPYSFDPARMLEVGATDGKRGKMMYFPTEEEKVRAKTNNKPPLDETNSFLLPNEINTKVGLKPGTRLSREDAEGAMHLADAMDKHNEGKKDPLTHLDMEHVHDADGNVIPSGVTSSGHFFPLDTSAFGAQPIQQPEVGTVRPAPADAMTQPMTQPQKQGGGVSFNPKKPADKPEKEGLDHWVSVATDPDSSPVDVKRAKAAINLHNSNTAGALAAARKLADAQNEKPLSSSAARQITQKKFNDLKSADTAYAKANAEAVTPEEKQSALAARQQARQNAQLDYEQSISAATGKDIPHNSWADNPASPVSSGGSAAPATAAKPAQATPRTATAPAPATPNAPAKKVASMATVRAYAKKNNLSEAAAIRAAKGEGFQIGQ